VVFLNRWNDLFPMLLIRVDGEKSRGLNSRYARSLEQARKAVASWRTEYQVAAEDVHDNSDVDWDHLFAWMDVDLTDELAGEPW
jgi:hypothetical protein